MQYRSEIDGLRALAVIPVIFFHAGFEAFKGGFVGVDVFFVISGYLITSIILDETRAGKFSLLKFYERRARRILPALFLVMLVSLPFAWHWLLPIDTKQFSQSLVAASLSASNIFFWLKTGYFNTANELKPLLHTWSLGVEVQFYLLFPLPFVLLSKYGKRPLVSTLVVLAILSLLAAQWSSTRHPSAGFYLLPTRGWELLMGAVLAVVLPKEMAEHRRFREILSVAGILLIAYAIARFDSNTPFPGLYALVPTGGAAILIACATANTLVGRLLGWKPLVGLGLISYSAYLWHQPLFAMARQRSIEPLGPVAFVVLTLTALALAFLSWKYVEGPFRNRKIIGRRRLFVFFLAISSIFFVFGFLGHSTGGYPGRQPQIASILSTRTVESSRCMNAPNTAAQLAVGEACMMGHGPAPIMAVVGDSHAGAIFDALDAEGKISQFAFYAISNGFCAPMVNGFRMDRYALDCPDKTQAFMTFIIKSPQVRYVVLFAQWPYYLTGFRDDGDNVKKEAALAIDDDGAARVIGDNAAVFARSLRKTVAMLQEVGKQVIIVTPVPEFHRPVMPTILKYVRFGGSADIQAHAPVVSVAEYAERNALVLAAFKDLRNVTLVDSSSVFCNAETCSSVDVAGNILYSDTNHVTEFGARLLVQQIMKSIGRKSVQ
ncbi:acyltransferase family protein [Shewanella sp.]|uniref:acyltransferase family protein n=1 Tax=Shewanella sp. TaxID=50422 RepID=UPI0040476541